MRTLKAFAVLSALGLILFMGASPLVADESWRTPLTISEPTEIPGMVLEPGKYIVQVLNTKETRLVVQFLTGDGAKNVATVLAIPNYRVKVQDGSPFTYFQRGEGAPQALKDWFYVGNNFGIEFVYPRDEAFKIAQASKENVYSAPSAKVESNESVVYATPQQKEEPIKETYQAPATTMTRNTAPAPPPEPPASLPATGSNQGLLVLAGLAALGSAAALRFFATR